jgi:hypothetical protein
MRKLFGTGFLLALLAAPHSHAQTASWSRSLYGPANAAAFLGDGYIITRSLAADAAGNVIATGSTSDGTHTDFLTTKLSASTGAVVWQKVFAGTANKDDDALALALDSAGNAVVAGLSFNTGGVIEIKAVKYAAADGAVLWERSIPSGAFASAYAVALDAGGNVFIGAEGNAGGTSDIRIVKLAAATGATIWDQTFNGGADDFISDLAVDSAGNVVVTGVSSDAAGNEDFRILKYNGASGALAWQQSFNGGANDEAYGLALDAAGNAYVTGYASGATADFKTIKYAAATGAVVWQATFDGGRADYAQAVAVDAAGNAIVTGQVENAAGNWDFKTIKYAAATGAVLWDMSFDGGANDYAYQVAVDAADNVIVTGSASNGTNADWKTIAYAGSDGTVLLDSTYAGSAGQTDEAYTLAVAAGAVYVGGISAEAGAPASARVAKLTVPAAAPARAGVSASSTFAAGFAAAGAVDGDRTGRNWTDGGGWADATPDAYPDWLQVDFGAARTIDRVAVYTLQDNWQSPVEPTDTMTFSQFGIVDFSVQGWNGSAWVPLANVTGNNLVKRTVSFTAFNTSRIRIQVTRALASVARVTEVEAWDSTAPVPQAISTNFALASKGGAAAASSAFGAGYPASAVIDNERAGMKWSNGGGWADATLDTYPDWIEVAFDGAKTLDRVVVYTLQDNWQSPAEPADTTTFTRYGIRDFTVQAWNGTGWTTLATVTGNDRVKRTVTFIAVTTDRIRIDVTNAGSSLARVTEIEAWGVAAGATTRNVALASAGAAASASSTLNADFPVSAVNDNERAGAAWSRGGGWADASFDAYPDWLQIDFGASRSISRIVVYTVQDNWQNPSEPTDAMTFTQYGISDFAVQGWDGAKWVVLGTVTGNNLVKRTVSFAAFATTKIRVEVTRASASLSRITEVEAWGN